MTSARLLVRSGLSEVRLRSGAAAGQLYRAEFQGATPQVRLRDGRVIVQYRGLPFDWRKRKATLGLNTTIPWAIEIVGGVGSVEADLRSVDVTRFELTGGTETFQLELGTPRGEGSVRIIGGARTIRLERPSTVPIRMSLSGGTDQVLLDGTRLGGKGGKATIDSPGWDRAKDRYNVEVVGGSKSIEIVARPS